LVDFPLKNVPIMLLLLLPQVGAQIYDSYGQKCNHRFLLNYGFSVENNAEPDGIFRPVS
jgi:hypothetical protein